jgi:RND superfamily putative drug exporter
VLVPALILDVGRRSWWPSRLARDDGAPSGPAPRAGEPTPAAFAGGDRRR